jgi:hypothetical protein
MVTREQENQMQQQAVGLQTVPQFCERHNISRSALYREVREQRLKLTKIAGSSRISPVHEVEWLNSLRVVTGAAA